MKINTPLNLNPEEVTCFNKIVGPQLEELYSYSYDEFEFKNVKIFISKDKFPDSMKKPDIEEIKNTLSKIPKKDLKFISETYLVSYHCKDDDHKEIKGRTLPVVYKIIIYPKAYNKLNIILAHEIGHIIFEKKLSNELLPFTSVMVRSFIQIAFWSQEEKNKFIREEFANCYDNFINNPERLKRFPLIYDFFKRHHT